MIGLLYGRPQGALLTPGVLTPGGERVADAVADAQVRAIEVGVDRKGLRRVRRRDGEQQARPHKRGQHETEDRDPAPRNSLSPCNLRLLGSFPAPLTLLTTIVSCALTVAGLGRRSIGTKTTLSPRLWTYREKARGFGFGGGGDHRPYRSSTMR